MFVILSNAFYYNNIEDAFLGKKNCSVLTYFLTKVKIVKKYGGLEQFSEEMMANSGEKKKKESRDRLSPKKERMDSQYNSRFRRIKHIQK